VYEQAVAAFVTAGPCGALRGAVESFRAALAPHARANILGAALLHLTMPGVPDLYQGTEQGQFALVDPDNRRPVRFEASKAEGLDAEKLALTTAALMLRRDRPDVFGESAAYEPLRARGTAADHCVAFARSHEVVTAVTRLSLRLARAGGWGDTELSLPEGRYVDVLAPEGEPGREFSGHARVAEIFRERPVALLVRRGGGV
ncbi:malto-oligosyltrehalose synthase, partial [Streptomyces sp. T-3]|nr:malto-oligosyltrehalose synthase [Streptomyces sp. T-3]